MLKLSPQDKALFFLVSVAMILRLSMLAFGMLGQGDSYFFAFDDAKGYMDPAQYLLHGEGFKANFYGVIYPETARTPGYPALIAASLAIFKSILPLITLQIIIGSLLPILAFYVTLKLLESKTAAFAAAIFFTIDPLIIVLSTLLMTETIFMFLFLSGLWLVLSDGEVESASWGRIGLAGLLLSYATLIRPVLLYALPVMAVYLLFKLTKIFSWKKALVMIILFSLTTSAFVLPWMIRNKVEAGIFELTSLTGIVAYFYTGSSILSIVEGKSYSEERQILRQKAFATGIKEIRDPKNVPYFKKETLNIIKAHPKEAAKLGALSLFHLMTHDGYLDTLMQTQILKKAPGSTPQISAIARGEFSKLFGVMKEFLNGPWLIFLLLRLTWVGIAFFALLGVLRAYIGIKEKRAEILLAFFLSAAFAMATIPVTLGVHGRLRIPFDIFLISFAVIGFSSFARFIAPWIFRPNTAKTQPPGSNETFGDNALRNL